MLIEVYSDGSATSDNLPGGYGWALVVDGTKVDEGSGYMPFASNNDAELEAAIFGLVAALKYGFSQSRVVLTADAKYPYGIDVVLVSDSQIILNWANGTWRFKQEKKINKYDTLRKLVKVMNAQTRWVRGHSGDEHNERCDRLANAARLQTYVETPKTTKKSKIGKKTKGVFLLKYNGITKIVDLANEKCETYSEDNAPLDALAVIAEISDE